MKKSLITLCSTLLFTITQAYGITNFHPSTKDATYEVLTQIQELSKNSDKVISFQKDTYHFYPEFAHEEYCFISNHNDVLASIAFNLKNLNGITIDANGSTFIFHGRMIPFLVNSCKDVTIKNLSIDFADAFHSECKIIAIDTAAKTFDMEISKQYPYEIRNGNLIFLKPYYEHNLGQSILFNPETKAIAYNTESYTPITTMSSIKQSSAIKFSYPYKVDTKDTYLREKGKQRAIEVKEIKPGVVRVYNHKKKLPEVGLILASKGEQGANRFAPAFKVADTEDFNCYNVTVNHAGGMGFLFENSKNIDLYKCNIVPSQGRMVSTTADATHFVGCRGKISLRNCVFHNQLDDAMNVHGAYQEVVEKISANTLRVRVGHFQQLGFRLAFPGDTVGVVRLSDSFHEYTHLTVKNTEQTNGRYQLITFNEPIPEKVVAGDLLENLSAYPSVLVENCDISRNRARGLLISTPKGATIRNNYFSTEMTAILLPVESGSWFESGNASNVVIENNIFQDCSYGGNNQAVIRFQTDDENSNIAFSNVNISNNTFNHFDNLILFVTNVDGLTFSNNKINGTKTYPQLFPNEPAINVQYSQNILFKNNKYNGNAKTIIAFPKGGKQFKFK